MGINIAEQYYAQALENYPYCLGEAVEALNYALSYDSNHAGANCLMGKLQQEYFKNSNDALHYFEQALIGDTNNISAYESLISLHIDNRAYAQAKSIIKHVYTLIHADIAWLMLKEALIYELLGEFKIAKKVLIQSKQISVCNDQIEFVTKELERVESKLKFSKKPSKAKLKKE